MRKIHEEVDRNVSVDKLEHENNFNLKLTSDNSEVDQAHPPKKKKKR